MRLRVASSGPFAAPSDVDPGLSAVVWVDPDTTVPAAQRNGSIIAPYATVQAAHDALPANGGTIVLCFSADEVSAGDLVSTKSIGLQGLGQGVDMGDISTAESLVLDNVVAGNITSTGSTLRLTHARCGNANVGPNSVTLVDALVTGTVTAGQLVARDSELTSEGHAIEAFVQTVNCTIGAIAVSAGEIESENDSYISSVGASTSIAAKGSAFGGALACATLDAAQCTFAGELGVDGLAVSGSAVLRECNVAIDVTVGAALDLFDTTFRAAGNVELASGSGLAVNCVLGGDWDSGAELQIDSSTYNRAIGSGFAVTSLNTTFNDPPLSITLSVVVPAVLAASVGYVNTTLVGTSLENVFAVGDPVLVNPQSDLVAAGLGGGFINARISAANTLRCAFVGALAGGAANFTVARVR